MTRDYKLISADGHVNEPPTIWSERLPAKYRERAPRMDHLQQGDAWIFEGWDGPINFGFNASAGLPPEKRTPWIRWEDVPRHSYDSVARAAALDDGGVDAELLYATPRIAAGMMASAADPGFHVATVRAYNDWLSEFCNQAPDRLKGLALMPAVGAATAIEELHRAMDLPGIIAPYINRWPSGGASVTDGDDPFWAAVAELDVPVSVHVAVATGAVTGDADPNRARLGARGEFRGLGGDTAVNCLDLISSGAFDRYPRLRVVFAECESSWVPCAKQTFDDRFRRYPPGVRADVRELPSYYFDHHIFTTFVLDRYAIVNRHRVGLTQMLWSNDLFHAVCEWPHDWDVIEEEFAGVPEAERDMILAGNAIKVYGPGEVVTVIVDVDQHYYEADDCCTRYCDPALRERVPHPVATDSGEREWRIGDRHIAFERWVRDITIAPGSMHSRFERAEHGETAGAVRDIIDTRVDDYRDRDRRIGLLDEWGIKAAVLLPSAMLGFDAELGHDVPAATAAAHAFNRWVEDDWGYAYRDRIFGLPFISLLDLDAAVTEVDRVLAEGARMVMVRTGPVAGHSPAHPDFDPFWARVEEAGVPVVLHISASGYEAALSALWGEDPAASHRTFTGFQWYTTFATRPITDTLAAMVFHNLFGRFPRLQVVSIENGSRWVAPLLHDLDVAYRFVAGRDDGLTWLGGRIDGRPSEILTRHLSVAPYLSPGFDAPVAKLVDVLGPERVVFGSDWPHGEGRASPLDYLPEIKALDDGDQARVLHDNGAALLGI